MTPVIQITMNENEIKTLECLIDKATEVHLAVENRNIEAIYTFDAAKLLEKDNNGETPLHYAAINNDLEICKILINRNPYIIHITDVENKTAYDWMCEYKQEFDTHTEIYDFLKKFN